MGHFIYPLLDFSLILTMVEQINIIQLKSDMPLVTILQTESDHAAWKIGTVLVYNVNNRLIHFEVICNYHLRKG